MLDLSKLNPEQLDAATTINGPMLVLAGAGTGKTFTMTCRTANMIEQGINPEQILMLTFTNKAAKEMKDRLVNILGGDAGNKVLACTFHSFCALMLRKYGGHIGISPHFTILSPGDDEDIISIVKSYADKTRYKGRGFPPNGKVCDFISMAVNKDLGISDVMESTKYASFIDEVIELAKLSADYRKEHDMLNYDDILIRFIDLLNMKPDIASRIANTYQYIMVDEYQDTNPLQEVILLELFRYTKNIAVVGDDMQSLYGFRGAVVDNIIHFPDKFEGCKTVTLVRNYRSNQEILNLGNKVCQCATEGFPKELIGTHYSNTLPSVISVNNQYEETDYVIELIRRLHAQGVPYDEICVVERNSVLSAGIEVKLNKLGIEFDKYGGAKYTDLSYVKDILAYLKVMTNPYDEISWFRILQVHRGIGNVNARKISEKCRIVGFDALLDKAYTKRQYGPELIRLHEHLNSCDGLKLQEMIKSFIQFYCNTNKKNIEEMDTDEGSRTSYLMQNEGQREELQKLVEISVGYRSVDSFLDDLLLDNTKVNETESDGKLVISTIHSVKGLEYNTVIVLDCINGIFPNADEEGSKEDNEELRCFYVAVTRAKERLYLISPRSAMRYGQSINGVPSRYLKEAEGIVRSNDHQFFDRFKMRSYDDFDGDLMRWYRFKNNPYR
jgi:DNA helicase-2/ATP-dependent DNA helicase PcrA